MTARGPSILFLAAFLAAAPLAGQQDDRLQRLEKRLDELTRQVVEIRQEIDGLKAARASAPPAVTSTLDDLTSVDLVSASPAPSPSPAAPQLTDVQPIANPVNAAASKVFNPDISVIGNFFGKAGAVNPWEFGGEDLRQTMRLEEAELGFEAFVDPYAKAKFFLAASPEGLSLEEGFAQFGTLPHDLTAKVGRLKAAFGKANTWHTHTRPWVDQPLMIHNFFGDEQLADDGISVSRVFPATAAFVEGTVEVFRGSVDGVFEKRKQSDLFYSSHLKTFRDLDDDSNLEVGASWARGTAAATGEASRFGGIDVTYRWKPLARGLYTSLIARFEGLVEDRAGMPRNLRGFYASLDYQLAQRWFAGARFDRADRVVLLTAPDAASPATDRGASATLTFWPSEFSQLRGQLRRTTYGDVRRTANEFLFQLQFSIGAHGAHTF